MNLRELIFVVVKKKQVTKKERDPKKVSDAHPELLWSRRL